MIKVGFEKDDSENQVCLYKPGGHPSSLAILCSFSLTIVSTRMEVGFPVKLGDFLCRANLCGRGGGGEK